MPTRTLSTRCCIAGGGPAGIMLGYMLARAGIDVIVLEKWPDFFRDFRGDTIHPSTMQNLYELGLLDEFLKLPHEKTRQIAGFIGDDHLVIADFNYLKARCPYIAFIPQWDFLNFIAGEGKKFPNFHLHMATEATDLIEEQGRIVGIKAKDAEGDLEILAELVVGADGRHSRVREKAALPLDVMGSPIDVLWFRLSRKPSDPTESAGRIVTGSFMALIQRETYWQCAYIIEKDGFQRIQAEGIEAFRNRISEILPFPSDSPKEITDWDKVKLLSVRVDHLKKWHRPGLICIGDAAHAMSPIGGLGINFAIQDAVAAANILAPAFLNSSLNEDDLAAIQKRRSWVTRMTQRMQVIAQNTILNPIIRRRTKPRVAGPLLLLKWFPLLRWIPARLIGIGLQPEHVKLFREDGK